MDMKSLLEKMMKFAGEPEQKAGDQVRGKEKASKGKDHPFKGRLVGDSVEPQTNMLEELSQEAEDKSIEWKLAEEYAKFLEDNIGVEPKRPPRKGSRPQRDMGKTGEPSKRYKQVKESHGDGDVANAVVAEVIKLIGEGHTEVSPDVITTKVSAVLGRPFMLKDLVAANNSSVELQHYIDSINPSKIKFSTDILTVKNEDPMKEKQAAQDGVSKMASRAASRPRLGESEECIDKNKITKFHKKLDTLVHSTFGKRKEEMKENAEELNIGDDVIITGPVEFKGSTGVIDSFGRDKRFVVVNLYNHGRHSFHSSDVSFNEYADSDEEAAELNRYGEPDYGLYGDDDRDLDEGIPATGEHRFRSLKSFVKAANHLGLKLVDNGDEVTATNKRGVVLGEYSREEMIGFIYAPSTDSTIFKALEEDEYDDEDDYEDENEDQGFFVAISNEEDGVFIGMVVKEDGKWRERRYKGNPPYNWGGTYMGYLTPQDVMSWINKDYGRNYQVEGPMDEDEANEYLDYMSEGIVDKVRSANYKRLAKRSFDKAYDAHQDSIDAPKTPAERRSARAEFNKQYDKGVAREKLAKELGEGWESGEGSKDPLARYKKLKNVSIESIGWLIAQHHHEKGHYAPRLSNDEVNERLEDLKKDAIKSAMRTYGDKFKYEVIDYFPREEERVPRSGHIGRMVDFVIKRSPIKVAEGWESGPEERAPRERDPDWEYDQRRQEKMDAEADKLPKKVTYKLLGRGPNYEPNWDFGLGEFDTQEEAIAARERLMADPDTPNPRDIGIQTIHRRISETRIAKLTQQYNELKEMIEKVKESRGHKIIARKLADIERKPSAPSADDDARKTAQAKADYAKYVAKMKKKNPNYVPLYKMDENVPTGQTTMADKTGANDPQQAAKVAQATQAMKSATGASAPAPNIAKALDAATQGKSVNAMDMKAIEPMMDVLGAAAQDPKLANQFKTLAMQAKQAQGK